MQLEKIEIKKNIAIEGIISNSKELKNFKKWNIMQKKILRTKNIKK